MKDSNLLKRFSSKRLQRFLIQINTQYNSVINEISRKLIHVLLAIFTVALSPFVSLQSGVIIAILATAVLIQTRKTRFSQFLKRVERKSFGQYFLILGVLMAFVIHKLINTEFSLVAFNFTILTLGISDSLAVSGKYFENYQKIKTSKNPIINFLKIKYRNKTMFGASVFFVSTLIICCLILLPYFRFSQINFIKFIILSLSLAYIELISDLGIDNFCIPFFSYFFLMLIW